MKIKTKECKTYIKSYVGIDPGKTGAAALYIPSHRRRPFLFCDWPKDNNPKVIWDCFQSWIDSGYVIELTILEKVASMHKQGVKSVFSFGVNYGMWQALITVLELPYRMMPPRQWQKGLITNTDGADPKKRSKTFIRRLCPKRLDLFTGPRGAWKDGRADAAIMAYKAYLIEKGEK